jgi:hypothetical protein
MIGAAMRRRFPHDRDYYPPLGARGVIVRMPAPGIIGEGPTVRWETGHVTTLGSMHRYRLL